MDKNTMAKNAALKEVKEGLKVAQKEKTSIKDIEILENQRWAYSEKQGLQW